MYIQQVHTLIEQGLQNIGVFAYADMLPQELDLAINAMQFNMLDEQIKPQSGVKEKEIKFKLQYILDRFQNLQVKMFPVSVSKLDNISYSGTIPTNYLHLISDISAVLNSCNWTPILTGKIVAGVYYQVKGGKSIIYNAVTYNTEDIFLGVTGVTGYTYSGTGTLLVIQLALNNQPNRLTQEEYLQQVLGNALEKPAVDSPVSSLSGNTLYIYTDGTYYINKVYLTYLRKPNLVNSQFTTYDGSADLIVGTDYESVDNPIVYNGTTYQAFQPFTIVTGHLSFSGFSTVRVKGDGDSEFTDSMTYNLVSRVIEDLSIKTEQNQQKIVNLAQENV